MTTENKNPNINILFLPIIVSERISSIIISLLMPQKFHWNATFDDPRKKIQNKNNIFKILSFEPEETQKDQKTNAREFGTNNSQETGKSFLRNFFRL